VSAELLLDTGALVSILDRSQRHHDAFLDVYRSWHGPVVSTEAVLTEATHVLMRLRGGAVAVVEWFRAGGATLVPPSQSSLARAGKLMAKFVYIAFRGDRPVGYLRLQWLWSKLPYVELVLVLEPHRRTGVGRALLAHVEARGRGLGARVAVGRAPDEERARVVDHVAELLAVGQQLAVVREEAVVDAREGVDALAVDVVEQDDAAPVPVLAASAVEDPLPDVPSPMPGRARARSGGGAGSRRCVARSATNPAFRRRCRDERERGVVEAPGVEPGSEDGPRRLLRTLVHVLGFAAPGAREQAPGEASDRDASPRQPITSGRASPFDDASGRARAASSLRRLR